MNKILDIIYNGYANMPTDVSPLETPETSNAFWNFIDTYFGDDKSYNEREGATERFINLIYDYQAIAFEAGFKAAVQLFMGGGQA